MRKNLFSVHKSLTFGENIMIFPGGLNKIPSHQLHEKFSDLKMVWRELPIADFPWEWSIKVVLLLFSVKCGAECALAPGANILIPAISRRIVTAARLNRSKAVRDTLAFIYAKQVTMRNFLFIYVIKITYVGFTRPTLLVGRLYIIWYVLWSGGCECQPDWVARADADTLH